MVSTDCPVTSLLKVLLAVILIVPVAPSKTVTNPPAVTVANSLSLVHVTVCGAKFSVTTLAVSCTVCPTLTVAVLGVTVTLVTLGTAGTKTIACENGETQNVFHV